MSIRTFTVFQDTPSSDRLRTNSLRPNISTRSSTHNVTLSTVATGLNHLDKENFDPVTGEHAAPTKLAGQKRKTGILASKFQPSSGPKATSKELAQLENKRRRPSPPSSSAEVKNRKHTKGLRSSKKGTKRAGSKKISTLPRLTEEEEVTKILTTREELNSLCKELTVKPLADVSEAYDELNAFDSPLSVSEDTEERAGVYTVKSSSLEPEIRDFFKPSGSLFSSPSSSTRLRLSTPDAPDPCSFSTPQRKQIYSAFIFSSPETCGRVGTGCSNSDDISSTQKCVQASGIGSDVLSEFQ